MKECPLCQSCFPDTVEVCKHDEQPVKPTLPIETVIRERYRLEKRIGHGSVSIVYLARDLVLKTTHAVRIVLPELVSGDPAIGERFLSDATATSAVSHPNIVAVTDAGMLNGVIPFILMEYVSGPSLQEILSTGGALTPSQAFTYVSAIGAGLTVAHKLGVIHGDLKPRNILIANGQGPVETLKLTDFGLSRLKSGRLKGSAAKTQLTGMLRSPLYLAPEEWSDDESDNRSDIYSLGIILYQMLTGDVPFKGKSIPAIMKQHLMTSPPSIAGKSKGISNELEAVVLHALQKDPADRPPTVDHFVKEFQSAIAPKTRRGKSKGSGRRPVAKKREIPERKDRKTAVEVPAQLTEGTESPELTENTLLNYAVSPDAIEHPKTDFDQTIANWRPAESDAPVQNAGKGAYGTDEGSADQSTVRGPETGELTLVNHPVFDADSGSPHLDLAQTIGNSKPVEWDQLIYTVGKVEYGADEVVDRKPASSAPDMGDLTLVNYRASDQVKEPPQIAPHQTNVHSRAVEFDELMPGTAKADYVADEVVAHKPASNTPDMGELTLVNYSAFDEVSAPPQIALNLNAKTAEFEEPLSAASEEKFGADGPRANKSAGSEPSDFDLTIIPGMIGYPLPGGSKESLESRNDLPSQLEKDQQLSSDREPIGLKGSPQHSALGISADEADELPRSIAPIFLALGVVLVVLLIAVGVYYTHTSQ